MDRLSRALSICQNSNTNNLDSKYNNETMISEKVEKSLQNWKLPPSSPSDVFKRRCIFNCSSSNPIPTVKTVEKEIPLSEEYTSFPLFTDYLLRVYKNKYSHLHIGMIQVGLKPTKLGLNTSAVICLRDKRFLKFDQSVLGMVESSLCDGPIYFSYFPTHFVSLSDPHLSSTFAIDIKTQGSSTMSEGGNAIFLMYRFHYKVTNSNNLDEKNLSRSLVDGIGETTLFLTNIARSNRVVSKKIYQNQVSVPERWMVRNGSLSAATEQGNARIDWKEAAGALVLKVDVPGFKKEEIRVEVEDGRILQISGERSKELEGENDKWHCEERSSSKFLRRFTVPENGKLGELKADMENGVLTVTVPKEEGNKKPEVVVIDISG